MVSNGAERVLIRTLPLFNANYGGVLQAYALQQTLRELGYSPFTDVSVSNEVGPILGRLARTVLQRMPKGLTRSAKIDGVRRDLDARALNEELSQVLMPFIDRHIQTVKLYRSFGRIDRDVFEGFDSFLAGSDQVWRSAYGDVASYLFDFVQRDGARLISYAASFGRDDLDEYGAELVARTSVLARRFCAISVRETTGVDLCEREWGVEAVRHVDPTMLLDVEHYERLSAGAAPAGDGPHCLAYVLDESSSTRATVAAVSSKRGLPAQVLMRKPHSRAAWLAAPQSYSMPTVEGWLRGFSGATFVVTDSFHGTVFSILNNTPFVAIANSVRGYARFESLLRLFGLEDRLVDGESCTLGGVLTSDIDWSRINQVIDDERIRGRTYLKENLGEAELVSQRARPQPTGTD